MSLRSRGRSAPRPSMTALLLAAAWGGWSPPQSALMTETNAKFKRLLPQRAHGSLGQLCNLVDRCSRFGVSSKLSDIGFRILTTSDFLFELLSQLLLPILESSL